MNFKILCVDDEPSWVDSIRQEIEEHLQRLGFEPELIVRESGADINSFLVRPDIDLIMVDYHLQGGQGDELIKVILGKGPFIDLVFYSQDAGQIQIDLGIHASQVHRAQRDDVKDKVIELCSYFNYRYQNVDILRGLVVAESIRVESLLEDVMIKTFDPKGEHFRRAVLNRGTYEFKGKYEFVQHYLKERIKELEREYIASQKQNAAIIQKKGELDRLSGCMKKFDDDVIAPRNIVAHGRSFINNDGKVELQALNKKQKNIILTKEWVLDRRVKFAYYRNILNDVLSMDIY